uniref:VWFA domain-containing protein n=1 Tax=Alexandrium monilatum TaxID=311494 RepID=A0A7S4R9X8_9DINO
MLPGGARDARRFRAAAQGRSLGGLPPPSSLTCQGVFSQHAFHVGCLEDKASDISLVAHWGWAEAGAAGSGADAASSPPSNELWLGCFLRSRREGAPRDAAPLDLVLVLDTSGSMNCTVEFSRNARIRMPQPPAADAGGQRTRLHLAKEAVRSVFRRLREDDRLSVATFADFGRVLQPLEMVGRIDLQWLLATVDALLPMGGTTLAAGMATAVQAAELTQSRDVHTGRRHRRAVFLTDMEDARAEELEAMVAEQARLGFCVSFVGVGIDFNSDVAEQVTRHPGANYFCVTGTDELQKVMVDHFDRNFFPTVPDVQVSFQSDVFDVAAVYGTPTEAKKEIMAADWQPSLHHVYPIAFQKQVKELLLCWRRRFHSRLPLSLAQRVLSCLAPPARAVLHLGALFPCRDLGDGTVEGGLILVQMAPCKDAHTAAQGHIRIGLEYTGVEGRHVSTFQDHKVPLQALGTLPPPPSIVLRQGILLRHFVEVCRRYLIEAASPRFTVAKLNEALRDLEAFHKGYEAELEFCPGVREDLVGFCRLAHNHCEELLWMGR